MKTFVTRVVLAASVALGTLMAAQAADAAQRYNGGQAYDAQANPNYRFGPRVTVQPGDVVSGNSVIGRDTDPFIRDQLLREFQFGTPGLI
jgi:hypothetical protein